MKRILYHMDPDGFASGAIAYKGLLLRGVPNSDIEMHPVNYGKALPKIDYENDEVIMVDFSLQPAENMVEFAELLGNRLTWIDHHDTSLEIEEANPKLRSIDGIRFSEDSTGHKICGCELTWIHFFEPHPVPLFIELIGDWDTWRWKDIPDSCAPEYITFMNSADFDPQVSLTWWLKMIRDELAEIGSTDSAVEEMIKTGTTLLRYKRFQDKQMMEGKSFEAIFAGHPAILVNSFGNTEMFEGFYDPKKHDLMVGFQLIKGEYWNVGLYSETPEKVHCGQLAKELGNAGPIPSGGGHEGAAGFQTTWEYLEGLIEP